MAGFISNMFGTPKQVDEVEIETPAPAPQETGAYFLSADEASTLGNTEYMRTAKRVKRTFPKTASGQTAAWEREISAMEMRDRQLGAKPSIGATVGADLTVETGDPSSPVSTNADVTIRRKADSSLDLFRRMAKGMNP